MSHDSAPSLQSWLVLEDGHQRISLVIWTSPGKDLKSGLCSWYLAEALQVENVLALLIPDLEMSFLRIGIQFKETPLLS